MRFIADQDVYNITIKVLPAFLWVHVQFTAVEQYRNPEIIKVPEPPCN